MDQVGIERLQGILEPRGRVDHGLYGAPSWWKVESGLVMWCSISFCRLPPKLRSAIAWNGARSACTWSSLPPSRWRYCTM